MAGRVPWWVRLNRTLFPVVGPAQLGPFNEPPLPSPLSKPCPLCGTAMSEHTVERRDGRATKLHCPGHGSYTVGPNAQLTL
ncbi:MAG TPA: hypothetical protein VN619_11645 [Lacisediminihabitans sp.]|nr:hypothetical protein [Lacisediminihabitans sp.]HXD62564.1 hypothetical protein [Lacisediminihabitans sp.]